MFSFAFVNFNKKSFKKLCQMVTFRKSLAFNEKFQDLKIA